MFKAQKLMGKGQLAKNVWKVMEFENLSPEKIKSHRTIDGRMCKDPVGIKSLILPVANIISDLP